VRFFPFLTWKFLAYYCRKLQEQPQLWLPAQNNFFIWWEIFAVTNFFEIFFWLQIQSSNFQKKN
jgi:hypothetical protein